MAQVERNKFIGIEANTKEIFELIEDFHTILRTSGSSAKDDAELLNTFCQDFDVTTERMVASVVAILTDFEKESVRKDVNYIIDDIDELSVNTIELLNENLESIPESVQQKANNNFKEIMELLQDLVFIIHSSLGVQIDLPEKEKKLILDQIEEIASETNNNNNSIKLIIENEKDIEKKKQEIEQNESKPPEEVFSNLLDLMDSKLNEIFTQAQDSQIDTKLENFIRFTLKSIVAILKPNIALVEDGDEKGDYEGLLQDYNGTVKSYLKSVKNQEDADDLQDEIQDKTEELVDLVRALKAIPIKSIPGETMLLSAKISEVGSDIDAVSSSEEETNNHMEEIMRKQKEQLEEIMRIMDEKEDAEYFTLLEKLENLCEKQKKVVLLNSHAIIFLNYSIQTTMTRLVLKTRKHVDIENPSQLQSFHLLSFDIVDALEEESLEFINYAKKIASLYRRKSNDQDLPKLLQMFEFTFAKLKLIFEDLSQLKESEIEERGNKSEKPISGFTPMQPPSEPVLPPLDLYIPKLPVAVVPKPTPLSLPIITEEQTITSKPVDVTVPVKPVLPQEKVKIEVNAIVKPKEPKEISQPKDLVINDKPTPIIKVEPTKIEVVEPVKLNLPEVKPVIANPPLVVNQETKVVTPVKSKIELVEEVIEEPLIVLPMIKTQPPVVQHTQPQQPIPIVEKVVVDVREAPLVLTTVKELVVHHGEQDLTLSLPEPQLVVEEEVVLRKKRGNATQLPSAYKKVETVEHVPKQLEKIHARSMQREILERIQRENEQRGGATEFQKLAQKMLRSNHLTESTAQPTPVDYTQLTTMQRLIKEDELQKEIFKKEQEERALALQRQREKQQKSQPKIITPSKVLSLKVDSAQSSTNRINSPTANRSPNLTVVKTESQNNRGSAPRIQKKNWFAAFEEPVEVPEVVKPNNNEPNTKVDSSKNFFTVLAPKKREELIKAGLDENVNEIIQSARDAVSNPPSSYNTPIKPNLENMKIESIATPSKAPIITTTAVETEKNHHLERGTEHVRPPHNENSTLSPSCDATQRVRTSHERPVPRPDSWKENGSSAESPRKRLDNELLHLQQEKQSTSRPNSNVKPRSKFVSSNNVSEKMKLIKFELKKNECATRYLFIERKLQRLEKIENNQLQKEKCKLIKRRRANSAYFVTKEKTFQKLNPIKVKEKSKDDIKIKRTTTLHDFYVSLTTETCNITKLTPVEITNNNSTNTTTNVNDSPLKININSHLTSSGGDSLSQSDSGQPKLRDKRMQLRRTLTVRSLEMELLSPRPSSIALTEPITITSTTKSTVYNINSPLVSPPTSPKNNTTATTNHNNSNNNSPLDSPIHHNQHQQVHNHNEVQQQKRREMLKRPSIRAAVNATSPRIDSPTHRNNNNNNNNNNNSNSDPLDSVPNSPSILKERQRSIEVSTHSPADHVRSSGDHDSVTRPHNSPLTHKESSKNSHRSNKDSVKDIKPSLSDKELKSSPSTTTERRKSSARKPDVPSLDGKMKALSDEKPSRLKDERRSSTARSDTKHGRKDKIKTQRGEKDLGTERGSDVIRHHRSERIDKKDRIAVDALVTLPRKTKESASLSDIHTGGKTVDLELNLKQSTVVSAANSSSNLISAGSSSSLSSIFTIHLSESDKKSVPNGKSILRDVLDKMLSARGIEDEMKKSYICRNVQNHEVDTSLALNSFEFNEVFYCTASQMEDVINHWINKKLDVIESPPLSARDREDAKLKNSGQKSRSVLSLSGSSNSNSTPSPTPREKARDSPKPKDNLKSSSKDLNKNNKDEKDNDVSLMGSISRAFSSQKKDRFSSQRMDRRTFEENDDSSGSKTDRNKRKPSFTIPVDLLGEKDSPEKNTSSKIGLTKNHSNERRNTKDENLLDPQYTDRKSLTKSHSQDKVPNRTSSERPPERPTLESPRMMLMKREKSDERGDKVPERPATETPKGLKKNDSAPVASKKVISNSMSIFIIHCEDFNQEKGKGGLYSVKLDVPTKNGVKVRRTKGVPKRLNFVSFNELFTVDFPTFPPPMKLQYIYKTFEDKKQKSMIVLGEQTLGEELFSASQLDMKQQRIIKVPMLDGKDDVEFWCEITFSSKHS